MIRLESIPKQNGKQIVFIEASATLQRCEKVGLVGPNGAGKTTLFRMVTAEEQPDEGQVYRGVQIACRVFAKRKCSSARLEHLAFPSGDPQNL